MLKLEDLSAWYATRGITAPRNYNRMPDDPTNIVVLTDTGGFGLTVEWAFDQPTFQARCRGATGLAARDLAHQVDRATLDAPRPFSIGGYRVIDVGRVGGPPAYMETDERGRT